MGVGTWSATAGFDNLAVRALTALPGKTWYVNGSVSQSGDGASWHSPFKTIQEGIEASYHGDTVIVAGGTYYQNIHFLAKNITLRSADPLDPAVVNATTINGGAYTSVVTLQGDENETCVLSGFTITNGKSPYSGGVLGQYARPTIRHNVIFDNWGDVGGGLAFCHGRIENNTLRDNRAIGTLPAGCGGGLYKCNGRIQDNVIASNTADAEGGGLSECNGEIWSNVISANSAARFGGGLHDCNGAIVNNEITLNSCNSGRGLSHCDGEIRGNIIRGNDGALGGGGLALCYGPITNNIIIGNSSHDSGGGLFCCSSPIRNNIIAGNVASLGGGGGLCGCFGDLENNVIVGNSAQNEDGGGLYNCCMTVVNCIIWGNKGKPGLGPQIWDLYRTTVLSNCTVEGGWTGVGSGNIALDPQFDDPDGPDNKPDTFGDNDYRLKPTSPCIDKGKNERWMWGALDLDGNNRVFKGFLSVTVDMGAYEYGSYPFKITRVEEMTGGKVKLTWNSRAGDTYHVWSLTHLVGTPIWKHEATVPSQGQTTFWTGGISPGKQVFYTIDLK